MSAYVALAPYYDALMPEEDYRLWADCCDGLFKERGLHTVLDLACGTGTLSWLLAERGYEVIGVDLSSEMLAAAAAKGSGAEENRPLFLHQNLESLDLYGTVQAAVCSMDGANYLPGPALRKALERVSLFLEPGGLLLFDLNTPEKLHGMDGAAFVSEAENVYCVWRGDCPPEADRCVYGMDLFIREGKRWRRESEEHTEYLHDPAALTEALEKLGFGEVRVLGGLPLRPVAAADQRLFFLCIKSGEKTKK